MSVRDEDPFAKPEPKPIKLDEFSISELHERIDGLKAEILRCEALIAKKQAAASAAAAVFGPSS